MCWCKPRGLLVSIAQVRLGGGGQACIRNVAFERYFAGIAVAFKWCFWWCMGGLLLVGFLVVMAWHVSCHRGRHFNCVFHPCCTLVAHDISGAFAVLTGRAYI